MRAAVLRKVNEVGVEDVDLAGPGAGEVLVRLSATGVCHTDLGPVEGQMPMPMPLVLGHEGAGIVEEVGPGVSSLKPGDHVVLASMTACGHCFQCSMGAFGLCETMRGRLRDGLMLDDTSRLSKNGEPLHHFLWQSSFAEHAVVSELSAIKIRDDAPLDVACLFGCGAMTGIGAVLHRAQLRPGESVMILGVGGVGLSALLGAQVGGAYPIIAVDRSTEALEAATRLGATHVIDSSTEDVAARVREITTRGVDHAIDVVGAEGTIDTCLQSIRPGGQVVAVGVANPMMKIAVPLTALMSEKRLTGTIGGSTNPRIDIPRYVDLFMAGRLPMDQLVQRTYKLDDIGQAFDDIRAGKPGRGVVVFD